MSLRSQQISLIGFIGSLSKKGCSWDAAVAKSSFDNLAVHWRNYEAQQDVMN